MPDGDAPELFLIDGNSLAYRAFFALPESIATADGRPTNAIYGLASMLVKIIDEHHPGGVVVAWDAGMSGREVTYDLYKAQRKSRPDLLREQWPHLMPLVEAFGYTNVKVEGYEADDVIATLARRAREEEIPVMVVTGDRDAYQLVGDGIRVMSTTKGITETKIYDREAVIERYGVPPELVTDLMGLRGDTSDNIPGVPGIGEKTAAQLLQKFGSLEDVLANVEEVSGAKRKQNLVEHADDARMSKQLATLQYDLETGVDLAEAMAVRARPRRPARVHARVRAAGGDGAPRRGAARGGRRCPAAGSRPSSRSSRSRAGSRTSARARWRSALDGDRWAAADAERTVTGSASHDELAVALGGRPLAGHDLKCLGGGRHGLLAAAAREGVELEPRPRHDGRRLPAGAAAPHLRAGRARRRRRDRARRGRRRGGADEDDGQLALGEEVEAGSRPGRGSAARRGPRRGPAAADRGARPGGAAARGRAAAGRGPGGDGAGGAEARRRAPRRGRRRLRRADRRPSKRRSTSWPRRSSRSARRSRSASILFEKLGLTRKRRGKTGFSTDARVLAQIRDEHPIVEKIESWRELTKLKNTYLDSLPDLIDPETGRVHTTFNQTTAATGRLSSTNPNLQNIPIRTEIGRPVRACFVAEKGARLLSADYSQVELRVLAEVADEEILKEIFRAGDDVHAATAAEVFNVSRDEIDVGQRSKAKMVNFGIVYGLTGFGLADRLNIPRKEGEEFVARYLERFPAVRAFREEVVEQAPGGGLRDDADGPPPADPRAALGQPQHAPPRRAARGQHRDPGHRRRHHQGGDGALPARRCARRGRRPAWSCRSTTSCSSRARRGRWTRRPSWCGARCAPPTSSTRRSRSTSASARTGSTPSRPRVERLADGAERRSPRTWRSPCCRAPARPPRRWRRRPGRRACSSPRGRRAPLPGPSLAPGGVPSCPGGSSFSSSPWPGRAGVVAAGAGVVLAVAEAEASESSSPSSWWSHSWPQLDPGVVGDDAGDGVAAEQGDRQLAGCRVVRGDRAGVLVAVHDPVVVAVAGRAGCRPP